MLALNVIEKSRIENTVKEWFEVAGFAFDPFVPLNAATDSRLSQYMIHHEAFEAVWGDWISLAFAPPGGGKTALSLRVAEACYVGQETNRPFPVCYAPPLLAWGGRTPSLDDHLLAIGRAASQQLLLALAYRPHWFFRLDRAAQERVRRVLDWNLPGPLASALDLCRQTGSVAELHRRVLPALSIGDPPAPSTLMRFCATLESLPGGRASVPPPAERWAQLVQVVRDDLKFTALYVLVDGVDAAHETAEDPARAADMLAPLLARGRTWSEAKIYLKAFLPVRTLPLLAHRWPELWHQARRVTITWTPPLLVEMVRQRIYVATQGSFSSLDAVSSPALSDVEAMLAEAVLPLPREMLVITRRLLWEHVRRVGPDGQIEPPDLEAALAWYRHHRPAGVAESVEMVGQDR